MDPEVEGVGGTLKSKFRSKTSFLKRSQLDIFFAKKFYETLASRVFFQKSSIFLQKLDLVEISSKRGLLSIF